MVDSLQTRLESLLYTSSACPYFGRGFSSPHLFHTVIKLTKNISGRKKARNDSVAWWWGHLLGREATTLSCWAAWALESESLHRVRALDMELPAAVSGSVLSHLNYKFLSENNQLFLQGLVVYTAIKSDYCDTCRRSSLIYAIIRLDLN